MMENKSYAFLAGVFTIGLAVLVLFALFWFSSDHAVRVPYDLVTRSTVNGLGPQADVKYRGLAVGKVESIKFDPQVPGQIIVRISVNQDTPITRTTYATLGFQGVTGIAYVQLDDTAAHAGAESSPPLHTSPKEVARIAMRPGFFEELEKRGDSLLTQAETLMASLNDMFQTANRNELMAAIRSVRKTAEDFSKLSDSLVPAANRLPRVAENLNATLESTRRLTQELARPDGTVLRTVDSVGRDLQGAAASVQTAAGTFSQETLPQLNGLARDARQTARSFERAAGQFNDSPTSVLFGAPAPAPGPGEPGFSAP
ncbi:MlaD family protein [Cupriavidus oxalaticus]|jgi:phospholipid/cholesterol/gamma-HCH transport system substrate-binding protein|uniref:ABC-type transporter, periplasmic component n=1 Tax=Cupriavidus oxalaticus TaxID=96344 RepID=A0A375FMZ9_9BURK|nr:MlaD family protein [Cupriavidus oxalaticus]QEZ45300.1 MCE family protein [Cupriavidus oxalaticus]QRQ87309.1 MCE family protein [Cupriavidus oxalaticus]QRQ94363.1 MCE family protein [Cupriavidus oxalaticus]WQD83005.1 MlaD family protein [Cupriavidus oxalaticus]SPC06026.1 putative ABC-type transporter, periplasmic component [Cupriavidus oxalaticus]